VVCAKMLMVSMLCMHLIGERPRHFVSWHGLQCVDI